MPRSARNRLLGLAALLATTATAGLATDPPAAEFSDEQVALFEKSVRPVLAERCWKCHGPEKQQSGLRLDSRAAILAGGDTGMAAAPGDVEQSRIVAVIRYGDDIQMPPDGKLPADQIAALTRWVQEGLPWPGGDAPAETSAATPKAENPLPWSFRPRVDPPAPEVSDADWAQGALDRFVLAGLERAGLRPAPPASKATLIRRATFDLWGLPPTPEEIAAFEADAEPGAFARLIERLLASPHYGQRWGRHWLDVARYADSNGQDENLAYVNAYRYRDWVVDALNRDMPYDQFVACQVAGDLLPGDVDEATRQARIVATGFLCLGPKMLAEDDPVKMEMDIVDEQVDTLGTAFLGLTLGCARCHDHKFDPVSTADYYALAGIFKSTQVMDNFRVVAQWHERPLGTQEELARAAEYRTAVATKQAQIAATTPADEGAATREVPPESPELRKLRDELAALEQAAPPALPAAMAAEESAATNLRVHLRGSHLSLGDEVARAFPHALPGGGAALGTTGSGRLELARWMVDPSHPLTARVIANRVWRWHFGAGLVRSTDNFGNLGEAPSHPELLDWLAAGLIESGWSLKALHRTMMLSATYQMSTAYDAEAALRDPDNRLLWRANRHRLEAEALRDALLYVGGNLDLAVGGTLLHSKPREYVTGTSSVNATSYVTNRRSLYLPVVRSALYDVFQAFDFAEPNTVKGDRDSTTLASQALFMLNSELVGQQAGQLAELLAAEHGDDGPARVAGLYRRALARWPSEQESQRALAFVADYGGVLAAEEPGQGATEYERDAWQALCRVVLSSNEFLHVE